MRKSFPLSSYISLWRRYFWKVYIWGCFREAYAGGASGRPMWKALLLHLILRIGERKSKFVGHLRKEGRENSTHVGHFENKRSRWKYRVTYQTSLCKYTLLTATKDKKLWRDMTAKSWREAARQKEELQMTGTDRGSRSIVRHMRGSKHFALEFGISNSENIVVIFSS